MRALITPRALLKLRRAIYEEEGEANTSPGLDLPHSDEKLAKAIQTARNGNDPEMKDLLKEILKGQKKGSRSSGP